MARHNHTGYLNFPQALFMDLFHNLGNHLELFAIRHRGRIISSALIIKQSNHIDYFLAANERCHEVKYANHFLIFEIARWAKLRGFKCFHLGGGARSLMQFKSGFSKSTKSYFIGRSIFLKAEYGCLLKAGQEAGFINTPLSIEFSEYRAFKSNESEPSLEVQLMNDHTKVV